MPLDSYEICLTDSGRKRFSPWRPDCSTLESFWLESDGFRCIQYAVKYEPYSRLNLRNSERHDRWRDLQLSLLGQDLANDDDLGASQRCRLSYEACGSQSRECVTPWLSHPNPKRET